MSVDAQLRQELLAFQRSFLETTRSGSYPNLSHQLDNLRRKVESAAREGLVSRQTIQLGATIGLRTREVAASIASTSNASDEAINKLRSTLETLPDHKFHDTPCNTTSTFFSPPRAQCERGPVSPSTTARNRRDDEDMTGCKAWCEENWRYLYPDATAIRSLSHTCNAPVSRIQTWFSAYRKNSGYNALNAHLTAKGVDLRTLDIGHDRRLNRADEAKIELYRKKLADGGVRDFVRAILDAVPINLEQETAKLSISRPQTLRREAPAVVSSGPTPVAGSQANRRLSLGPVSPQSSFAYYPPSHLTRSPTSENSRPGDRYGAQPSPTSSNPSPTSSEYGWSGSDSAYSTDATAASMYDERPSSSRRCPSPGYGRTAGAGYDMPAGRRSSFSSPSGTGAMSRSLYGSSQPPSPQSARMPTSGSRGLPPSRSSTGR